MVKKDENTEINKGNSLEGSESKPLPKKRGRPRKIKIETEKPEIQEIQEEIKQINEEEEVTIVKGNLISGLEENINSESESAEKSTEINSVENISKSEKAIENTEHTIQLESEQKEKSIDIVSDIVEDIKEETNVNLSEEKIKKKSNYKISLVDENHLRTKVLTNKLIGIFCSVKDKTSTIDGIGERQTNKIFIHPKVKPQEVEIMISIGSMPIPEEVTDIPKEKFVNGNYEKDSNYQVSLVDENLLRIIIITEKSVSVDCSIKDEDVQTDGSNEIQANKIFIHPKDKPQEVEVIVSIGSSVLESDTVITAPIEEKSIVPEIQKGKLTPNPLVANLIQKFSEYPGEDNGVPKTPEEKLEEKLGPKNPWRVYKELMQRNLIAGLIGSIIIYLVFVGTFYKIASKKNNNTDVLEVPRLIVMQDLPENQFQQQNVEDPNKPPEQESTSDDATNPNKIPPIVPKKVKPPRVIGPPKEKIDTSTAIDKELDSLRKINQNVTSNNKTDGDTTQKTSGNFPFPDSILTGLKENEVGLVGRFPPYWKQIDSRSVNINEKEFSGVILVDTSVKRKEEALNMSVQIDKNNEYWKMYNFKNVFAEDSLKNVIYSIEPKQEGDQTYYRFYISGMAYNIYIAAFINNEHFEKHKAEIEQVVRTIRIQKPATPPGK